MKNQYATKMRHFFDSVDASLRKSPVELAKEYVRSFTSFNVRHGNRRVYPQVFLPSIKHSNTSIVSKDTSLNYLSKRLSLVSETTVLSHYNQIDNLLDSFEDSPASWGADKIDTRLYFRCNDIHELGRWLVDFEPLLVEGEIFYCPDIVVERYTENRYIDTGDTERIESSIGPICQFIVESGVVSELLTTNSYSSKFVRPILEIDLPHIEHVDAATFSKIYIDEKEPLDIFRDTLHYRLLELEGTSFYDRDLARTSLELKDAVRQLTSEYGKLKRKRAFGMAGAGVVLSTAVLVAVNTAVFALLPKIIGGGGLLLVLREIEEYINSKKGLKDNPYYFLWLVGKEGDNDKNSH